MSPLVHQRCVVHAEREAAARCPACRQFYCRECVTEHEGRQLCAGCLRKRTVVPERKGWRFARLLLPIHLTLGLGLTWMVFYFLGWILLQTPTEWHEGRAAENLLLGP
jgi:hypothetical protein